MSRGIIAHLINCAETLLRIPNGKVLEHPDEVVRTVVDAMGTVKEKGGK
jgi:hypothetical protein